MTHPSAAGAFLRPIEILRTETICAEVPPELADADDLLTRYGSWSVTRSRGGLGNTLERQYIREADRRESLEAYNRRRDGALRQVMMTPQDAMAVQRALARVPNRERVVLSVLYIPRRVSVVDQLRVLRIPASLCRERHLAGLRMFTKLHRLRSDGEPVIQCVPSNRA